MYQMKECESCDALVGHVDGECVVCRQQRWDVLSTEQKLTQLHARVERLECRAQDEVIAKITAGQDTEIVPQEADQQ